MAMKHLFAAIALVTILGGGRVLAPSVTYAQAPGVLATFKTGELTIKSGSKAHVFRVELAKSARQQQQGLMFRRKMAADAGMLFVYRRPIDSAMWMRNTYIPLDMLFIGKDGKIGRIAERTVPLSEKIIPSGGRVIAVLELNAGTASRLGIKPGDRVLSSALPRAAE